MGNTQSQFTFEQGLTFANYHRGSDVKDYRLGVLKRLRHIKTNQEFLMKENICKDPEAYQRLREDFEYYFSLKHPCLVDVKGFVGQDNNDLFSKDYSIFVVFEYISEDLHKHIKRRRDAQPGSRQNMLQQQKAPNPTPMYYSEDELISMFERLVDALEFLQQNGIAHGDIRPDACFFSQDGSLKICNRIFVYDTKSNFQLAKQGDKGVFLTQKSFEALKHGKKEPIQDRYKSDVFSLGMTLLECATLQRSSLCYDWNNYTINVSMLSKRLLEVHKRYSDYFYELLREMLRFEDSKRPDFVILKKYLNTGGYSPSHGSQYNEEEFLLRSVFGMKSPFKDRSFDAWTSNRSVTPTRTPPFQDGALTPIDPAPFRVGPRPHTMAHKTTGKVASVSPNQFEPTRESQYFPERSTVPNGEAKLTPTKKHAPIPSKKSPPEEPPNEEDLDEDLIDEDLTTKVNRVPYSFNQEKMAFFKDITSPRRNNPSNYLQRLIQQKEKENQGQFDGLVDTSIARGSIENEAQKNKFKHLNIFAKAQSPKNQKDITPEKYQDINFLPSDRSINHEMQETADFNHALISDRTKGYENLDKRNGIHDDNRKMVAGRPRVAQLEDIFERSNKTLQSPIMNTHNDHYFTNNPLQQYIRNPSAENYVSYNGPASDMIDIRKQNSSAIQSSPHRQNLSYDYSSQIRESVKNSSVTYERKSHKSPARKTVTVDLEKSDLDVQVEHIHGMTTPERKRPDPALKYYKTEAILSPQHSRHNSAALSNQPEVYDYPEDASPRLDKDLINFMVKDNDNFVISKADQQKNVEVLDQIDKDDGQQAYAEIDTFRSPQQLRTPVSVLSPRLEIQISPRNEKEFVFPPERDNVDFVKKMSSTESKEIPSPNKPGRDSSGSDQVVIGLRYQNSEIKMEQTDPIFQLLKNTNQEIASRVQNAQMQQQNQNLLGSNHLQSVDPPLSSFGRTSPFNNMQLLQEQEERRQAQYREAKTTTTEANSPPPQKNSFNVYSNDLVAKYLKKSVTDKPKTSEEPKNEEEQTQSPDVNDFRVEHNKPNSPNRYIPPLRTTISNPHTQETPERKSATSRNPEGVTRAEKILEILQRSGRLSPYGSLTQRSSSFVDRSPSPIKTAAFNSGVKGLAQAKSSNDVGGGDNQESPEPPEKSFQDEFQRALSRSQKNLTSAQKFSRSLSQKKERPDTNRSMLSDDSLNLSAINLDQKAIPEEQ